MTPQNPQIERVIRWVGVPKAKLERLVQDLAGELAERHVKIIITPGTLELWIYAKA